MQEAPTLSAPRRISSRLTLAALACGAASLAATSLSPADQAASAANARAPAATSAGASPDQARAPGLNKQLQAVLAANQFTGRVQSSLQNRMGRPINEALQQLGRQLFFDPIHSLHNDNSCAGCHDPGSGFADSQSIAIGVDNNMIAGPHRVGARNFRRSPTIVNSVFYPNNMWDGRFSSPSGDPFDNSQGFAFPPPEGTTRFPPGDPVVKFLLIAQAHMPSTELKEQAGFTGTRGTLGKKWDQFDNGAGDPVPPPDGSGYRNDPIRAAVETRINASPGYRRRFGQVFSEVAAGAPITFLMIAQAIAEWEATKVAANAPIDRFARGTLSAMTDSEKRGALLFFGKANCVACHAVSGQSNEMFSDFKFHNIGVPQIAPAFGVGKGDALFDGPGTNEDFGLADITDRQADRYKFRSAPLRNLALQPTFFHNGAFTNLALAIVHHLDVVSSVQNYDPAANHVAADLRHRMGPMDQVLATLDPLVQIPIPLTDAEAKDLIAFVRDGLLDPNANVTAFCGDIPNSLPSRMTPMTFESCPPR